MKFVCYNMVIIVILIFLIIITINQNNKINELSNQENMTTSDSSLMLSTVSNEINRIYNMDVEAIRNLGAISKSLLTGTNYHSTTVGTPGTLTIPADKTELQGTLQVDGNTSILGTLSVNGSILLPPGIIMAWYQATAPAGWGVCDGTLYGTIQSPDLRGRFITMENKQAEKVYTPNDTGNIDINTYNRTNANAILRPHVFRKTGGSSMRVMMPEELPQHNHYYVAPGGGGCGCGGGTGFSGDHGAMTNNAGNSYAFGLYSPYYVLLYIIKL